MIGDPTAGSARIRHDVERIARLEAERGRKLGALERLSQRVSAFAGSTRFLLLHAAWFGGWIAWNTLSRHHIDPYPFTFLTFLVSLEAIFLSGFVLISQGHLEQQAHRRAALDLQINLLAEKEMTAVLNGVRSIAVHLGVQGVCDDPETQEMARETNVEAIADAVDAAVGEEGAA